MKRGRDYKTNVLRKVSVDDKEGLFASIKKGQNAEGGTWGAQVRASLDRTKPTNDEKRG